MSKTHTKTNKRRNKKSHTKKYTDRTTATSLNYIRPGFPAEQLGIPAAFWHWLGELIASFLRPHRRMDDIID